MSRIDLMQSLPNDRLAQRVRPALAAQLQLHGAAQVSAVHTR